MKYRVVTGSRACAWYVAMLLSSLSLGTGCHSKSRPSPVPQDSCARWTDKVCTSLEPDADLCGYVKASVELLSSEACALALQQPDQLRQKLSERSQRCGELASKLCADLGSKRRACAMVQEASRKFTPERCVTMLHDYPQVLANLERQASAYQLAPEQAAKLTAGEPPALGPATAKLQLIEFVDFENRDCAQGAMIIRELARKYGDQLHYVVRQFPLPYNAHAHLAAQAALAAHAQGKFWQMHDLLLAHREQLERASLERYAQEIGLDRSQFKVALDHERYAPQVDTDVALGNELSVVGMPTLFVNGERMLNAVDQDSVVAAIEERLGAGN
jgi:protein-disulfide isomerase